MADEQTNSNITWFNSPLRGNQNVQTLIDMIKVGQWYGQHEVSAPLRSCFKHFDLYNTQNKESTPKIKYQPAVKFCCIKENVLQAIQMGNDCKSESDDKDSELERDSDVEASTNIAGPLPIQATIFKIDPDIDITSEALSDMVSVDPVVREQAQPQQGTLKRVPQTDEAPDWNW